MQKCDRARGELLLYTDQPRMMNGSASVSNCISLFFAAAQTKKTEKELFSGAEIEAVRLFMFLRRPRQQTISWREIYMHFDKLYTILLLVILSKGDFFARAVNHYSPLFDEVYYRPENI